MNTSNIRPKRIVGTGDLKKGSFLFFISTIESDRDISILKLKNYFGSTLLAVAMVKILQVIRGKNSIQALYIHNFECVNENHLPFLINILKHKNCNICCISV